MSGESGAKRVIAPLPKSPPISTPGLIEGWRCTPFRTGTSSASSRLKYQSVGSRPGEDNGPAFSEARRSGDEQRGKFGISLPRGRLVITPVFPVFDIAGEIAPVSDRTSTLEK